MPKRAVALVLSLGCLLSSAALARERFAPDRGSPGDAMIQAYLARETAKIEPLFLNGATTQEEWEKLRARFKEEYFYMLGLWPLPEKTPLEPKVTGTWQGNGYVAEKLHFQSRPRLYVTANLYRPAAVPSGRRLPAVVYVCGHSYQGRNGNKTAYQSHGIWLARHGYVCLTLDSLQLGEIAAIHHGTYREQRWWWHSRGYTPAGVECWNGVRAIDYLQGRPEVDPGRIGVTGISGGGAATYWIAAADERARVAIPVSGMADLQSYVAHRVINGHCDCMFLYNTFQWPWTRIAALVAPRPLLFTNSDADTIFPMDANDRVINRLERVYSLYGAADRVDAMVSIGGHAYRQDLRQAAFRFLNTYLKDDPRIVTDSEVDLVTTDEKGVKHYPVKPEDLRVFLTDADLPADELNTRIDEQFVPMAKVAPPGDGGFDAWKSGLVSELRRVTFRYFPERIPAAKLLEEVSKEEARLESEPGIEFRLRLAREPEQGQPPKRLLLEVWGNSSPDEPGTWCEPATIAEPGDRIYHVVPRGLGPTRWTRNNPPNYVERSHVLLGRTVDTGRVWDVVAAARFLHAEHSGKLPVYVAGRGFGAVLAAYAALWEPEIAGAVLDRPAPTHMDSAAPQFLNVLRVCDVPEVLAMLAPRPLRLIGEPGDLLGKVRTAYERCGRPAELRASD